MKQFISGMLVALVAMLAYACTTGGAGSGGSSADTVLFKINGRPVTAQEFISSPYIRDKFRQYVFYESIKNEAKKYNAKVDEADFNKQIEDQKKNVQLQMGMSWADYLKQQNMTEKEYLDRMRDQATFKALTDARVKVTEEDTKKVWETDKEALVNQYVAENHLPDSEKAKVTYEQVKKLAQDRVKSQQAMMMQNDVVADIVMNAKLELVAVKDKQEAKKLEDLILNDAKEETRKEKEKADQAKKNPMPPANGAPGAPGQGRPGGQGGPPPGTPPPTAQRGGGNGANGNAGAGNTGGQKQGGK